MGHNLNNKTPTDVSNTKRNWKFIRRTLLTVFVLCGVLTAIYYQQLLAQLEHQTQQAELSDQKLLSSLNQQSEQQLKQISGILTSLEGVNNAILSNNPVALTRSFDAHWDEMEYDWNLDLVKFYGSDQQVLGLWSTRPIDALLNDKINNWVTEVNNTGNALSVISCLQNCSQYLIEQIDLGRGQQTILVTAVSILDTLNKFENSTGIDIGILRPAKQPETSTNVLVYKWGFELYSLSNAGINEPVLNEFASIFTPEAGLQKTISSTINDQNYRLNLYPLTRSDDSLLLILKNQTGDYQLLLQKTGKFAVIILFTLLGLQFLFYLSIKKLFSSTQVPVEVLADPKETDDFTSPSLTEFEQTELTYGCQTETPIDFDLTNENVMSINERLDSLKKYNEDINLELAHQMVTLGQERDQVRKILDNTQAIILTLKKNGSIASINKFGEQVTGYTQKEIKGKNFIDLYPDNEPRALNNLQTLTSIASGKKNTYRHEARMSCKGGKERVILWLHSRLNNNENKRTPLLTTGLDITESKQMEKNLSWLADHDSLTSLFNRRRFEEELHDALQWANNHNTQGALVYIDLDNFKDINDSCGHQVGDVILRKVANTLKSLTMGIDPAAHLITARLGGDEFSLLLRNMDEASINSLSKRILDALYQIQHNEQNFRFQLSCSIGIAMFPGSEENADELLSNADFAMYQAKMLGRNQYYMFQQNDSQREQTHHRMIWREKIENALQSGHFVLHYQPILNIQNRSISHYETLIRMLDDNGELISPGIFINIAERLGLIQDIDNFILNSAIKKQGELVRDGHDVTLAINLSGKAFDDHRLFETIKHCIAKHQARAEHLIFEITETAAVTDLVAAEKTMQQIQSLGCQFALDDFGVGFSSFYYLRELPVEYVKIDGSFVADLPKNADNQILVKALSEVAIGFNKLTVAEFVDSLQTLHILKDAKVNYAQGYFIGKPSEKIPVEAPNFYQASINENTAIL